MQVSEKRLAGTQQLAFAQLRLLDLHDQLGRREQVLGALRDAGAGGLIMRILEADSRAGAGLHQDLVTGVHELTDPRGHQADSIFMNFDFFGNTDFHRTAPLALSSMKLGYSP